MRESSNLESKRPLVFDVGVFYRMQPMPKRQTSGDDHPNQHADEEKQTVSRQRNEEYYYDCNRNEQCRRPLEAKAESKTVLGSHTATILAPF